MNDRALRTAVREIEEHVAQAGWDRPARLFALVDTAALLAAQPSLAGSLGLDAEAGALTPVEQEGLPPGQQIETVLPGIEWPPGVIGCAATLERLVLPPEADAGLPEDPAAAVTYAQEHPLRQEVRIVAAALRGGPTYCALRLRGHDPDTSLVEGPDLVPELLELLTATLDEPHPDDPHPGPRVTDNPPTEDPR